MAPLNTRRDAAARLNVSLSTVDRLIRTGELPVVKLERNVRIRPSDLEAFIEERVAVRS